MAPKQENKRSNPRLCRMFLKQRSKRASQLLWPKRRYLKKNLSKLNLRLAFHK